MQLLHSYSILPNDVEEETDSKTDLKIDGTAGPFLCRIEFYRIKINRSFDRLATGSTKEILGGCF